MMPMLNATLTPIFSRSLSLTSRRMAHGRAARAKSMRAFHANNPHGISGLDGDIGEKEQGHKPPNPTQSEVATPGAQHDPSSAGFHTLLSGTQLIQGTRALTKVVILMVMMQNQIMALILPFVRRRRVIPNEVLVQPIVVNVMVARELMIFRNVGGSDIRRSQLWWPNPFSTTIFVVIPSVAMRVTWKAEAGLVVCLMIVKDERLTTNPSAYQDPVIPPKVAACKALRIDTQAEEDGSKGGQDPVDSENLGASVIMGELSQLLGCHLGRHGGDWSGGRSG
jgi:hypothetical protein